VSSLSFSRGSWRVLEYDADLKFISSLPPFVLSTANSCCERASALSNFLSEYPVVPLLRIEYLSSDSTLLYPSRHGPFELSLHGGISLPALAEIFLFELP